MNTQSPLSPKAVGRRYLREIFLALLAYIVIIVLVGHGLQRPLQPVTRTFIALSPLVPLFFVCLAVLRFVKHTDEMIRRVHVQSLAVAAGLSAFLALTYGCLEMAGLPKLSAWWMFVCIDFSYALAACIIRRRQTGRWFGGISDP